MPPHRILKTIDFFQRKQANDEQYIDELWREFGSAVREARRDQNVGLKAMAAHLGVSRAFVGYLESGKRQWNFEMAKRVVKILSTK